MTAYSLTPVGALGPIPTRARVVIGPEIGGASPEELHREIARLLAENDTLRAEAAKAQEWREKWAAEVEVRFKAQHRLSQCARVFAVLSHVYPELRRLIAGARKDIWNA